jgi:flagella basal body P-ring formation protein FlgA
MATVSIHTIMATTSSCQPPIIQLLGSARVWERVTGEKQSRARNPVFLRVWWVAPGVAEVGSLFPQVRRSAAPSWSVRLERQVGVDAE